MFILASAENFAYTVEQVTVCFLCGEEIFKNNNINNRSLNDLCFGKVGELSYSFK